MHLSPESHAHHLSPAQIDWVMRAFGEREGFFIATAELPKGLGELSSGLYGPIVGDRPVSDAEARYETRAGRAWPSRLVRRPSRPTRVVTVIGGPDAAGRTVLYTAYGGPAAPREPGDPSLEGDAAALAESTAFWREHALAE